MSYLWLAPLILAIDQLSKWMVASSMAEFESIPVLGDFFRLTYIHNHGAAFGIDVGSPLLHLLFSLVALGALGWMFYTAPPGARLLRCSLSMVLGGALGNIVDRVRLKMVVDFFDFGLAGLRWPVFNVADTFVTIGICLLILTYSRQPESETPEPSSPSEAGSQA